MELFSNNKLIRKNLAEKLYKCRNSDNYVNDFINIVEEYISKYKFESDKDFIFGGRKKFLYDEFYEYLDNKEKYELDDPVRFAIGNLEEFITNNNLVNFFDVDKSKWKDGKIIDGKDFAELSDKNDRYSATGYICLEEKDLIVEMLNRIKKELFSSDDLLD